MKSSLFKAFALSCMVSFGAAQGMQAVESVKNHVNQNLDGSSAGTAILAGEALALAAICYLAWDYLKVPVQWFDSFVKSNSAFVPSATMQTQMRQAKADAERHVLTRVEGAPAGFNEMIEQFHRAYVSGKSNGSAFFALSHRINAAIQGA